MHIRRTSRWLGLAFVLVLIDGHANDGLLDPTFAGIGKMRVAFDDPAGNKADHAAYLLIQPNGAALVMGSIDAGTQANVGLARVLPSGAFDPAFNGDGNSDGKVVVGFLETMQPRGMALLSDGRIIVAGRSASGAALLTRRTANGDNIDPFPASSFGFIAFTIPGATNTEFIDLLGVAGGKFLAAGTVTTASGGADFFVARLSSDGVLDNTFGASSGYTRIGFDLDLGKSDQAVALAVANDGRIALIGTVSEGDHEFGIAMLQSNGQPDMSFDGDGKAVVNFDIGIVSDDRAAAACFAPNGNLLIAGTVSDAVLGNEVGLALLSKTGSLVSGFGSNGRRQFAVISTTSAGDVACARDGRFLLTGTFDTSQPDLMPSEAFVTRFLADGSNDNTFGSSFATTAFGLNRPASGRVDRGIALAQDSGGRIYAAFDAEYQDPDYDFGLARLAVDEIFADGFE